MAIRVLVADDMYTSRLWIRKCLEEHQFVVEEAKDGKDALTKALVFRPDVVLLDFHMPEMDGMNCCIELRKMPPTAHIPIVLVSFVNDQDIVNQARESGFSDFLSKPFKKDQLVNKIKMLLDSGC